MASEPSQPEVMTHRVRFGDNVDAFLAEPARPGQHPTVILLHERYGLVQHTLDLAAKFAREGFVCMAPNLFARHPEQDRLAAGEIQAPIPDPQSAKDLGDGIDFLRQEVPSADASSVAVMGVCQTGRHPLVLAAARPDVRACLVFYGAAQPRDFEVTETQPEPLDTVISRIPCPVLGVFGEADFLMTLDDVRHFRDTLEKHRKSYHIKIFAAMPHGWLNDTMPGRYRPKEAEEAWQLAVDFLHRVDSGAYPKDRVRWLFESDSAIDYDPSKNVRLA
ncbi:MAG TPA: dienelactone hydrolase family protein [Chloroflexota bacterium]|nr:dienelactone hydrolase family protein [Chloroflexota bacterium]